MEKQCTYQSPAFCLVPAMVSDTMLQAYTSPAVGSLVPVQAMTVDRRPSTGVTHSLIQLLAGRLIPPADPD